MAKTEKKYNKWIIAIAGILFIAMLFISLTSAKIVGYVVSVPYTDEETYYEQEPYTDVVCSYKDVCARYSQYCTQKNFWGNCVNFAEECVRWEQQQDCKEVIKYRDVAKQRSINKYKEEQRQKYVNKIFGYEQPFYWGY